MVFARTTEAAEIPTSGQRLVLSGASVQGGIEILPDSVLGISLVAAASIVFETADGTCYLNLQAGNWLVALSEARVRVSSFAVTSSASSFVWAEKLCR